MAANKAMEPTGLNVTAHAERECAGDTGALLAIPALKLSDRGLFSGEAFQFLEPVAG